MTTDSTRQRQWGVILAICFHVNFIGSYGRENGIKVDHISWDAVAHGFAAIDSDRKTIESSTIDKFS